MKVLRTPLWHDAVEGLGGAAVIAASFLTPFLRGVRSRWGVDRELARRRLVGDDLVPEPTWSWTHGIEIDARADEVWPWVAQIGADRAGFYSYQWLENIAGCRVRNADSVHPEWAHVYGDSLRLHPDIPPIPVVLHDPGRAFVAFASNGPPASEGRSFTASSWLFLVEPVGAHRCRFVSRYRGFCSGERRTRLEYGPTFLEPIGFAMDRRMLLGVKERAEGARLRHGAGMGGISLGTTGRPVSRGEPS